MAQQTFEEIVAAVKQAESRGKRYAADGKTLTTSPKGALGEMQVMPKTILDPGFGVTPARDKSPDEIARVGRDYLQAMLGKYGDTEKALVAYNWGPGATDKWLASGAKPEALPAETRTYVQRVKGLLGKDVPRETMAKKEREPLPASLPPMAQAEPKAATVAIASGKSLPDIKSLPASYQAAFALAALADAKDDEKEYDENKETESEKLMREYKPVNHLASLDLSVTPIMMKDGGDVDAEEKRPDDIKYFSNVNRMKDRGVTTDSVMLGARTKAGEGSVIAGLNMANMSKDEKMQTARALMLAYTQQDPEGLGFSANVVKPQGAPAMANLIGSMPLGEGRVSAGMHGNQAYSLGYERPVEGGQFNANLNVPRGTMGSPQLNLQFNKRFKDGGDVSAEQERLTPQQMEQYVGQKTKAELLLEKFKEQAHPRNYTSIIGLGPNIVYETYKYATGKDPLRDLQKELQKKIDYEVDTDLEPIGTRSGPISGNLPPIRRAEGSPEEGEDVSKPFIGNPNIRKQGEAARRLAAMRDVNTLPDPKTYAAVAGALGTRPDQMGFSVLNPKYKEIMDVANPAFYAGTALQVAPVAQGPGMGRMVGAAERALEPTVRRTLEGGGKASEMLQALAAPPSQMFVRARPEAAARHADLQAQGLSPEQIRAQNLTLVDNRGNLIEEISDAPAVLQQKTASVPRNFYDMLQHSELKSIYPGYDMPDVRIGTTKRKNAPLASASFDEREGIRGVVRDLPGDDARNTVRGTLLHEGQHAIQSMEGFTEGANPSAFVAYIKAQRGTYHSDPTVNENVIREMERAYPNLPEVTDRIGQDLKARYGKVFPSDRRVGEALYRHMPGEVQAELARIRSNLTPEELKATPLEASMQQLNINPANILQMSKSGSRPDRQIGDLEYDVYGYADGGDVSGERLTPQQIEQRAAQEVAEREAASNAAFIAQKSGIGRKAGNISNALNTGTAYPAMAQGALDVPYDLAGLPVDLTTMAMRPFGYSEQKPVFGSEYFKDLATEAGIRRPTPTDPTLKGFHTFGQVGAGLLAPGKVIEGAQALKGAAKDALAGFKAGRAEKPGGMVDLMTGQRIEPPVLTPQQQAEQQTVAALFDNLAGANQQQIAADVAAGRLPAYVAPQLSYAEVQAQNIARLPQDAQEQLRLFEEAAARPRPIAIRSQGPRPEIVQPPPATVAITQPATKLPPPPPFVAPPVSAEFPFVGRLDEFAAGMKGPAQKEQLINQVKGKFREQDVARLEEALAGLGPKDKVTPAMLQDALANTYSPSRYRSAEITATSPMYQDVDNVFSQNKPIAGSMNLYLKESPESMALYDNYLGIKNAAQKAFTSTKPEEINLALDSLRNNPLSLKVPEINGLIDRVEEALPTVTRFGKMRQDLSDAETMILYPVIYRGNGFEFFPEATRRAQLVGQGMDPVQYMKTKYDILKQEESKLIEELMQKGSDKLVALGGNPIDVKSFMQRHADDPSLYHSAGADDVIKEHIKNNVTPINDGINAALSKVRDNIANVALNIDEKLKPFTGYAGRHRAVTGGDNMPIGFSRFTEHAVDIDGRQLKGRHVHELQSDLSRDIRELGPKGGALEKDQAELATLKSKLAGVDELDPTQKLEKIKLDKRVKALEDRVAATSPGKYSLEQPFAGFETNSPVRMQLLIKNAIQSSIRAGQDFVTFPGKESKQAQLYEKLLPNLKQAVKDLGGEKAGFEIKPITLPNPTGDSPTVYGVIWSPETAAKAIEKGVPFNKGGMVERKTDDNRRYL